jgi:hypothetical protein
VSADVAEYLHERKQFLKIIKHIRDEHPTVDMDTLKKLALKEAWEHKHKSANFYRMQATRELMGGSDHIYWMGHMFTNICVFI